MIPAQVPPALLDALGLVPESAVAFVGAGGKTTAAWRILRALGGPAFWTTTTHILEPMLPEDVGLLLTEDPTPEGLSGLLRHLPKWVLAARRAEPFPEPPADPYPAHPWRLQGLPPATVDRLIRGLPQASWLIEADGARRRRLKWPAEHEPALPTEVDAVVVVAGLEALGRPIREEVHRWEEALRRLGGRPEDPVTPAGLAALVSHPEGGGKGIPIGAHRILLFSSASRFDPEGFEAVLAALPPEAFHRVVGMVHGVAVAARRWKDPRVAAILLAAGEGRRFGAPKALAPWGERPLVRHGAALARRAGLDPIVVVVGAAGDEARRALAGFPVQVVENPAWPEGMSRSIQAGLEALPPTVEAVVLMQVDQPLVRPRWLRWLVEAYRATGKPIVVSSMDGEPRPPALFARPMFPALMDLRGDQGGRSLVRRFPEAVAMVPVPDPTWVLDVDTPEAYREALRAAAG